MNSRCGRGEKEEGRGKRADALGTFCLFLFPLPFPLSPLPQLDS
jgi:hypothetical protein